MRSDFVPLEQEDVPTPAANTPGEVLAAGGEIVDTVPFAYAFFRFRAVSVHDYDTFWIIMGMSSMRIWESGATTSMSSPWS